MRYLQILLNMRCVGRGKEGHEMRTISLEGACDLHIHSAPDIVDRIGNDIEIALRAREAGMRAIVLKSVLEPTVSRAWHVTQQVEGIRVFGGVVLDYHVGGLNPMAVSPAIEMGAKIVWLPTYHALGHEIAFGALGSFGYTKENSRSRTLEPITILDEEGNIKGSVMEIMEMCKDAGIILATGHIHASETLKLARAAKETGFRKLVVDHPFFKVPDLDIATVGELVRLGAYMEFCANELCPIPRSANLYDYISCFEKYGVDHFILASDAGHNRKGWPAEELRIFAQLLGYAGAKEDQLHQMMNENYNFLLSL